MRPATSSRGRATAFPTTRSPATRESGSLYRHFPNRLGLAVAVFEDNFAELERLAAHDTTPWCFETVWRRAIEMARRSTAFVEMVVEARRALGDASGARRFKEILREPLDRARSAGLVDAGMTVEDLALAQRMALASS